MHVTAGKQRAADGGHLWAALGNGEACVPHDYFSIGDGSMQEAMCAKAERASDHARRLAARHLAQAERFLGEAEQLKALARALKSEAAQ